MYVLIHSDNELLKPDNGIMVFPTHDKAYAEMVDQLRDAATDEEIVLADKLEVGTDLYDESDYFVYSVRLVGYLDDREAYLETSDDKWVIFEVPGAFIPENACKGFRKSIREATEMYGDESRMDWCDADKTCREVCWELEEYIGYAEADGEE